VIRKFRVDELPQLINVLLGTMSMIGPRPEQKAFADDLEKEIPLYPIRYAVRPGITGWAQVMYGPANDISTSDARLSYDLFYIKNLSWMMDVVIFFKTLKTIITGFGAR
jgi:lipopolysaccharide/colanic/teichoic acid biosynthesis glycosyltransferase